MNQTQGVDIPLHDIKPLLEIEEYSFYYFLGIVFLATVLLLGLGYLLYRYLKTRNRYNKRKEHYQILQNIDLHVNPKDAAYKLTHYGATFKDDSPRHEKHYELMLEHLEDYKYKKDVDDFDDATLRSIENYRGMIDV